MDPNFGFCEMQPGSAADESPMFEESHNLEHAESVCFENKRHFLINSQVALRE